MKTELKEMMEVYTLCNEVTNEHAKVELLNYIGSLHSRILDLDLTLRNIVSSANYNYPCTIN